ncbi:hypothetical protein E2C01_036483 [Portunus trituberculatus]|uniref:Uncharacterized protein n=1 Tax=Portunus trituberculatus TaxID=210409 RepID=A0A5B7F8U4_PORTR|nr:hypothetical protein [Portunus trituberculatus]
MQKNVVFLMNVAGLGMCTGIQYTRIPYTRQSQVSQSAATPATRSKDASRPRPSYLVKPTPQNGEIRSNLQNKIGQSQARSTENISTSTVSKGSSVAACE